MKDGNTTTWRLFAKELSNGKFKNYGHAMEKFTILSKIYKILVFLLLEPLTLIEMEYNLLKIFILFTCPASKYYQSVPNYIIRIQCNSKFQCEKC